MKALSLENLKKIKFLAMVAINKVTPEEEVHSGDVTSIAVHNGFIFSAGSDSKIKVNIVIQHS